MSTAPSLSVTERSSSMRLALVFALRMFGLFVILPVFAPYAQGLPIGFGVSATPAHMGMAIGLAMGAYGLTQAFLYIPYGLASDRIGRKPIIYAGLLIFAAGSLWAAYASTVYGLAAARALQGAGAISSVVVAMVADTTRDEVRTRAMAMIGMSIALTFAVSLVVAPLLFDAIGMRGIFMLIAAFALLALGLIASIKLPPKSAQHEISTRAGLKSVLTNGKQWLLNTGVFVLHGIQMAMWVVIPSRLIAMNFSHAQSTWLYLIVIVLSMGAMVPLIIRAEKYGKMHSIMRLAIALIIGAQLLLALHVGGAYGIAAALLLFFTGFNVLEATQPSLLSKITHPATKGAAAGVYNTVQALGLFLGSVAGAWLNVHWGATVLFIATAACAAAWLVLHQIKGLGSHYLLQFSAFMFVYVLW